MNKPSMPKINLRHVRVFLLTFVFVALAFIGGYYLGKEGYSASLTDSKGNVTISRDVPLNHEDVDFALFWRVWDTLEAEYFDKGKLDKREMVYGAIAGMTQAIGDPYTVFLPPTDNKVFQEDLQGNFEGVGIQIGFRGSRLAVVAPLPGTPADEAGIKAGDFIAGIKDEEKGIDRGTIGITLPEAVQAIRGPAGSTVTLVLTREGEDAPVIVDVVRESIDVPSVILEMVEDEAGGGKVAHIRVLKFGAETAEEWDKAVRDILKDPEVVGVVIDLRNNPGGFLQSAVDLGAEFVDKGSVIVIEESANGTRHEFKTDRLPKLKDANVVVLVNKGSASASEILAGSLRDVINAQIVGDITFGKGTIQEPKQLEGGAGLHITTSKWLTPSGFWVNEQGLTPDVEIEDDVETAEDEQLQEAIKILTN